MKVDPGSSCGGVEGGRDGDGGGELATRAGDNDGEGGAGPDLPPSESVWLLAGRTDRSFAAIREALSVVGGVDGVEGEHLSHSVCVGPDAPGGEAAAIGRLKRCASP